MGHEYGDESGNILGCFLSRTLPKKNQHIQPAVVNLEYAPHTRRI
jgi:hypothetical protein